MKSRRETQRVHTRGIVSKAVDENIRIYEVVLELVRVWFEPIGKYITQTVNVIGYPPPFPDGDGYELRYTCGDGEEIVSAVGVRCGKFWYGQSLGAAYKGLGEYRRAIDYCEQQLQITREIGDRQGEGNALFNSALTLEELGDRAGGHRPRRSRIGNL